MKSKEIKAIYINESHRWGDTIIATVKEVDGEICKLKTQAEQGELIPGLTYAFYGHWETTRWGDQFRARSFVPVRPADKNGVIAYLKKAPGVGAATAGALWETFGSYAVNLLRTQPEQIAEKLGLKHFGADKAKEAAAYLEKQKDIEDATISLMSVLAGKGFPRKALKECLAKWGNRAADMIKKNPYHLLQIPGCGFARTDTLYLELGLNPTRLKRQTLCAWYAIKTDMEGHTWFSPTVIESTLQTKVGSAEVKAVRAVRLGIRSKLLDIYRDNGTLWITEASRSKAEQYVADRIADANCGNTSGGRWWPQIEDLDISDHQKEKLELAIIGKFGHFGGGPGTGKTYSAARLIKKIVSIHGMDSVAVVAPTGKAAVRISEALVAYGLNLKAKTIHSYLGVLGSDGGDWSFQHHEGNPVEEKYVVVDECSMIDISLMAALLRALPPDMRLLLVGDLEQLPPVGHGAPLRDLIQAGIPTGILTEILRNSGAIIETCAMIRDQELFPLPVKLNLEAGRNLVMFRAANGAVAAEKILQKVKNIRDLGLDDPVWGVQVICAVNDKSPLSRKNLNKLLQVELNKENEDRGRFWDNDKVVCLRNSFWPVVERIMSTLEKTEDLTGYCRPGEGEREFYVANGEIGRVVEEYPNRTVMEFFNPRRVILVPRGEAIEQPFDLGYAISCHKSQGSEWPVVIIAIDDYFGARLVCDRSWLYTAISRAKRACILVGQEHTIRQMVKQQKIGLRKTHLVERIRTHLEYLQGLSEVSVSS